MRPGTDSAEHLLLAISSNSHIKLETIISTAASDNCYIIVDVLTNTSGSAIVKLRLSFVDGFQNVSNDHI